MTFRQHVLGYNGGYVMGPGPGGYVMGNGGVPRYGSRRRQLLGDGAMDTPALRAAVEQANAVLQAQSQAMQQPAMRAPMVQFVSPVPAPSMMPANCDMPPQPGYTPGMSFRVPGWRGNMLAPGVPSPGEGLVPLPMTGAANGLFVQGGLTTQIFNALTQNPFKPVRLMFIVTHLPAVAGGPTTQARVQGQIFVGTKPQQSALGQIDLESLGAPTAFGTDIDFDQAEPGVGVQLQTSLSTPLTIPGETILVNAYFLGRNVS